MPKHVEYLRSKVNITSDIQFFILQLEQVMYMCRNMETRFFNRCCSGKTTNITYSECAFVALGIQHAMRMRDIVICGLPDSTVFFHIISYKVGLSGKKMIEHNKYVLIFSATFFTETFFNLGRTERDMIRNVHISILIFM